MCFDKLYQKWFFLQWNYWNNSFSYQTRKLNNPDPCLYIPPMISWTQNELKIWEKTAIEEVNNNKLISSPWLENFIYTNKNNQHIFVIDNHNHALFCWYYAYINYIIPKKTSLVHIDQHTDMNDNPYQIDLSKENNLSYIKQFVNYKCNVWNFIKPAIRSNIVKQPIQIVTEPALKDIFNNPPKEEFILDIDIDFRDPNLPNIDYEFKFKAVKTLISKAKVITIATSPFFINQELAINITKKLLD